MEDLNLKSENTYSTPVLFGKPNVRSSLINSPYNEKLQRFYSLKSVHKMKLPRTKSKTQIVSSFTSPQDLKVPQAQMKFQKLNPETLNLPDRISEPLLSNFKIALQSEGISNKVFPKIICEILDSISALIPSLQDIFQGLKKTIISHESLSTVVNANKEIIEKLKIENLKQRGTLENLQKEKMILVRKLDKSVEIINELNNSKEELERKLQTIENKYNLSPNMNFEYKSVIGNILKQNEKINFQKQQIKDLLYNEIKMKKVFEKIIMKGIDISEIIKDVNEELTFDSKSKNIN
ncbi:hypothetical protein SteCoe_915 [Stentor coeruleus]|uniref:Uncharacterized protein n=1 Tax=Stentor coeruleus TaxID=5963 RepID=A0A1R2D375_9CILI|nr:hypothetical protein SteCoe_915 [Stentor coeruleus]